MAVVSSSHGGPRAQSGWRMRRGVFGHQLPSPTPRVTSRHVHSLMSQVYYGSHSASQWAPSGSQSSSRREVLGGRARYML